MEDTHVRRWIAAAATAASSRPSTTGKASPKWAPDGRSVYFTVQEQENVRLYRQPTGGGPAAIVAPIRQERGSRGSWSIAKGTGHDVLAFALNSPDGASELFVKQGDGPAKAMTSLNDDLLRKAVAATEAFTFRQLRWAESGRLPDEADRPKAGPGTR